MARIYNYEHLDPFVFENKRNVFPENVNNKKASKFYLGSALCFLGKV